VWVGSQGQEGCHCGGRDVRAPPTKRFKGSKLEKGPFWGGNVSMGGGKNSTGE